MWAAKCGLILDADPRTSTSASMEILRGFLHLNVSPYLSKGIDRLFLFIDSTVENNVEISVDFF